MLEDLEDQLRCKMPNDIERRLGILFQQQYLQPDVSRHTRIEYKSNAAMRIECYQGYAQEGWEELYEQPHALVRAQSTERLPDFGLVKYPVLPFQCCC